MAAYTVRLFDESTATVSSESFEGATDGEAINRMLDLAGENAAELWCGDRKVLSWAGRAPHTPRTQRRSHLSPGFARLAMAAI
jgi:hypothetical protein